MKSTFPVGKLPPELLARLLIRAPGFDHRVRLGPGIGLDCAVIEYGENYLVFKSDPITFATDQIGWYAVQVNANDIATSGAEPKWMLMTLLLPEQGSGEDLVERIFEQVYRACGEIKVSLIGGHTEITHGILRPILIATMIGEVEHNHLVTPRGAKPGDFVMLTKGVPIEATALIAREFPERLKGIISTIEIRQAVDYLFQPGISVLRDAHIATHAGEVSAMHDPTEGGLLAALWELAEASAVSIQIDSQAVPVPSLSRRICQSLDLDPLCSIASGALLLTVHPAHAAGIIQALNVAEIACAAIGVVGMPPVAVWDKSESGPVILPRPERDAITRLYEGD
jgi:hydrogenase expression/formation protein HypE